MIRTLLIAAALLLSACAPSMQLAKYDAAAKARAQFEADAFVSFDGARLPLEVWAPPPEEKPWAVVLALHGINSSARAFNPIATWLSQRGVAVYAYDARGFGRSPHRGYWAGADLLTQDASTAMALLRERYPTTPIAVLGGSLGAAQAILASTTPNGPRADRVVLVAPGVMGWDYLPPGMAALLRAASIVTPWARLAPSPEMERASPVTDNPETLAANAADPLRIRETRIDVLAGAMDLMQSASSKIGQLSGPVAFLYGEQDHVIDARATRDAVARLPKDAKVAAYPQGFHLLLRDRQAERVYEDVLAFLRDPNAPLPSQAAPTAPTDNADR